MTRENKICEECGKKTLVLIEEVEIFFGKKKVSMVCEDCSEKFNDCEYVRCPQCKVMVLKDSMVFDGCSDVCTNCLADLYNLK